MNEGPAWVNLHILVDFIMQLYMEMLTLTVNHQPKTAC